MSYRGSLWGNLSVISNVLTLLSQCERILTQIVKVIFVISFWIQLKWLFLAHQWSFIILLVLNRRLEFLLRLNSLLALCLITNDSSWFYNLRYFTVQSILWFRVLFSMIFESKIKLSFLCVFIIVCIIKSFEFIILLF